MKSLFISTVLFLSTFVAFAQEFKVSGTIYTEQGEPLPGVNVVVKGTTTGTQTDFNGNYQLKLSKGDYTLIFSAISDPIERSIELDRDIILNVQLGEGIETLDEVLLKSVRVDAESPITHSNLKKEALAKRNLGQDIATQLNFLPSVVTTSDEGAGIGYTGFRVRGTANQGINVTINGIPYNDAESATSFFVNLQDFTSSIENLQLQRGVGTSTNGPGAFGASLNILTDNISKEAFASTSHSIGSFNTRRHNVKFSTGLLNNHFEISGRLSQIQSDGYIDRASSDLKSYFLQAAYQKDKTLIKAIHFAGSEVTYQSWFGIDAATLETDRTFNPAGARFDSEGNLDGFHPNQVDDYKQDHYQLHWTQRYNNNWSSNFSFNYTYGRGFFEEYENDEDLTFYGIGTPIIGGEIIETSDIVRRRWLDNDFFVFSGNVNYKDDQFDVVSGLFYSTYEGDHFGEVIWARFASDSELGDRYYFGVGTKNEFSAFAKADYKFNDNWQFYLDIQGRLIDYSTTGQNSDVADFIVDETYSFFNPKFGASYVVNKNNQIYASFARANREPNRTDFENGSPKPERLDDIELGWRHQSDKVALSVNGFYMDYRDQLVLTGALDNVGAPIRANSGSSYRLGVEIDARVAITPKLSWQPNIAISSNKNRDFFFQRDGVLQNLGDTNISFSPNLVAGNTLSYIPVDNLYVALLSKYVGEQYMGNIDSEVSKLDSFFINDFNVVYTLKDFPIGDSLQLSGLVNNIFNTEFVSNGYFFTFDDDFTNPGTVTTVEGAGFYPQATINFLLGATLNF